MISLFLPFVLELAQSENPQTTDDSINIENVVVTASKNSKTIQNLATAVSVVTKAEILEKNITLLPDLLREEAGVYIQQTTPGQGIPIIRGLKGSENVHLIDGMRLNTAFFRNSPNQYLALVDSFMTEQIEIIRGPASVLYGGDALGGVLNINTHTPEFFTDDWQTQGDIYFSYDSADDKTLSHVSLDLGNEKVATSIGLSYQDIGMRKVGGGNRIPFTAYSSKAFNNKWVFNINDEKQIVFDYQYLNQPSTPRVDDLVAGFGQDKPDSSLFIFSPNQRQFAHLSLDNESKSKFYDKSQLDVSWQLIKDHRIKSPFDSEDITKEQNESTLISFQANFEKMTSDQLDIIYGLDYYHDTITSAKQKIIDGNSQERTPRFPNNSSMQHIGIYLDATFFFETQDITVGSRFSDYTIDLNSQSIANDTLDISDLTWHASWLYHLNTENKIFANLGRGFRPPNIFDLGQVGDRPGNRFNIINTQVKPETVHTLDVGWKHFSHQWFLDFAIFYSQYSDKITSVETGNLTDSGQIIVQSQNINDVKLYGFESSLKFKTQNGSLFKAVINYTWGQESTILFNEAADRIPPINGFLSFNKNLSSKWSITPKITFSGRQDRLSSRDVSDPRINPNGTGGFTAYHLFVNMKYNPETSIRLGFENIFDKKFREHGSGLDAAGRNVHLSINKTF